MQSILQRQSERPFHKMESYSIFPYDDYSFLVKWDEKISIKTNRIIHIAARELTKLHETEEVVPAYNSLLWIGKNDISDANQMKEIIHNILKLAQKTGFGNEKTIRFTIPVCYEVDFGLDMEEVAAFTRLSVDEIIEIHTSATYHVYMMGFLPGFPFLGGLDDRLNMPRKKTPQKIVARGSVGIGGIQTGIYPMDSPGGWNIIGNCPLPLYLPGQIPPMLIKANSELQFRRIEKDEFVELEEQYQNFLKNPQKLFKKVTVDTCI